MTNSIATGNIILVTAILGIMFILVIVFYIKVLIPFLGERRYIKMEISRTIGQEKKFWERQLKIFYLCCIPIVGLFIAKRVK